jgi:hypothetical protein
MASRYKTQTVHGVARNGEHLKAFETRDEADTHIEKCKEDDKRALEDGWITQKGYDLIRYQVITLTRREANRYWNW